MKSKNRKRHIVQLSFFVAAVLLTVNQALINSGGGITWLSSGYLHYVCPVCGVTTIYQYFASSADWITKLLNPVTFFILGSIIVAVFLGPVFCGWACPFGAFQDFVSKVLGKRLRKKKFNKVIPEKADKILRWLRYVSLGLVVYMTAKSAYTVLESINPYHAFLNLFVGEFAIIGIVVLAVIAIASLFIYRPWCKYLCPYGALLGIFNLFRVKAVVREESTCIGCSKCSKACPMNINVEKTQVVRDHQCISCFECTSNNECPVENTVNVRRPNEIKEKIKLNAKNIIVFVVAIAALVGVTASIRVKQISASDTDFIASSINTQLDGEYESGTFTGEGVGFNVGLTVEVTIDNNQITNIEVVSHNETIGYYEEAFETVPSSIMTEQSTDVDTVSGATRSSEGIIEAVNDALSEAYISGATADSTETEAAQEQPDAEQQDIGEMPERENAQSGESEKPEESAMQASVEAQVYKDGVYTGSAQGYGGELTVEVTVTDGIISRVEVLENEETESFLEMASAVIEDMISLITTEVDIVSGATATSDAIIEAVENALADAH